MKTLKIIGAMIEKIFNQQETIPSKRFIEDFHQEQNIPPDAEGWRIYHSRWGNRGWPVTSKSPNPIVVDGWSCTPDFYSPKAKKYFWHCQWVGTDIK
jgi:hypothetical protein